MSGRKFGLPSDQRKALLKGLVRALFLNDKITTTETRAKDVRVIAERLITMAKRGDIHARRMVRRYIDSNIAEFGVNAETGKVARNPYYVVPRLFDDIAVRFKDRPGGYCRITRIGARRGDGAPMVVLELVEGGTVQAGPDAEETPATTTKRRGLFARRK
ncbi:MAG: 50S ribosomal protein L17 [Chthonomonadales bacterium]|nr:50S ribosomal protein L17 [Chthonomonadales bacterium]